MFENGNQPQAVVMVPGVFELNMNRNVTPAHHLPVNGDVPNERKAA
jgi:hypothetical protein